MVYQVRLAKQTDIGEVLKLMKKLAAVNKVSDERFVVDEKQIKVNIQNSVVFCHLLELDCQIVGYTLSYYRYSTWRGREIYVEDIFIDEEHCNVKNYKLLLKCVAKYGHEIGCNSLMTACKNIDVKMKHLSELGAQDLTQGEECHYLRIDNI